MLQIQSCGMKFIIRQILFLYCIINIISLKIVHFNYNLLVPRTGLPGKHSQPVANVAILLCWLSGWLFGSYNVELSLWWNTCDVESLIFWIVGFLLCCRVLWNFHHFFQQIDISNLKDDKAMAILVHWLFSLSLITI